MADTPTTTYGLLKPQVGGSEDTWGTSINSNLDKVDDLLDGTISIKPNLTEGQWKVGGTAVTATAAELNFIDGVTSAIQAQIDARQGLDATLTALSGLDTVSGGVFQTGTDAFIKRTISGTANQITVTNGDGISGDPTVAAVIASQAEAEAGTDSTKLMTPLRVSQSITSLVGGKSSSVTLSGTSVTFTGIPAGVKKVQIVISAMISNSGRFLVRVGAGSLLTTGYVSGAAFVGSVTNAAGATNGFTTEGAGGATGFSGTVTLTLESGNRWVYHHDYAYQSGTSQDIGSGYISVGGVLDRVSLLKSDGTSFTSGTAIAYWEVA